MYFVGIVVVLVV